MWACWNAQNHVRNNQYQKKCTWKTIPLHLMKWGQYNWWRIWKSKQGENAFKSQIISLAFIYSFQRECYRSQRRVHNTCPKAVQTGMPDAWQCSWQAFVCNPLVWLYDGNCYFYTALSTLDLLCVTSILHREECMLSWLLAGCGEEQLCSQ